MSETRVIFKGLVHAARYVDSESDELLTTCGLQTDLLGCDLAIPDGTPDAVLEDTDPDDWPWLPVTCPLCMGIKAPVMAVAAAKPVAQTYIVSDRRAKYWREDPNGERLYGV